MVTTTSSSPLVVLTPERATFRTTRLIQARQLLVRATRHSPRRKHMAPEPRFPLTNMGPTLRPRCLRERNQLTILTLTTPSRRSDTWVRSLGYKTTSRHLEQLGVKERQFPRCERIHLSALVTSCPDPAGDADSIEKQRDPLPQVAAKTNQGSLAFMRTPEDLSTLPISIALCESMPVHSERLAERDPIRPAGKRSNYSQGLRVLLLPSSPVLPSNAFLLRL